MAKNYRIEVTLLGSGYAAIMTAEYDDMPDIGPYRDVADTGIGRYATREEAVREAEEWSKSEDIPFGVTSTEGTAS